MADQDGHIENEDSDTNNNNNTNHNQTQTTNKAATKLICWIPSSCNHPIISTNSVVTPPLTNQNHHT